jgi:3'-5' exoribonuclease
MMVAMVGARRFIAELEPGEDVDQFFLLRDRELRHTTTGSPYMACILGDRSGVVHGRWWQAGHDQIDALPRNGFVRIKGRSTSHRGQLQVIIDSISAADASDVDQAEFVPVSSHNAEAQWAELLGHLDTIVDRDLRLLIARFTDDVELVARFKRTPAGSKAHHAYLGGLLDHTLNVIRLARAVAPIYGDKLDPDLLVAGAFLHDVGKTEELATETGIEYTVRGNLVGHLAAGAIWIQQKADAVSQATGRPFPQEIIDLLQHMVLSHHGALEHGSPKLPVIPEAFVLHHLDNLDARIEMATRAIAMDTDDRSPFTAYQPLLSVRLFKRPR